MVLSPSHSAAMPRLIALAFFACQTNCVLAQVQGAEDFEETKAPFYGRIVDPDGNPVTDAEVTLRGPSYLSTETDEQGRFWFLDASEAGEYRLGIKSSKWVGITDYRKMPQISIDPDETLKKEWTLQRACQIELSVVDEQGEPVRASVYYRPLAGERFRNASSTTTNAEGVALIGGLAPSSAKTIIAANSKTHSPAHLIVSTENPDEITKHELVLSKGKSVKGKVLCSDGEPPAGWTIRALPTWWNFGIYPGGAKIEEDGSFELPHIGEDWFHVSISIPLGDGMSTSRNVLTEAKLHEMKQPLQVTLDYPSPKSMNYLTGTIRWIGKPLKSGIRISGYSAELKHHTSHHIKSGETDFKIGPIPKGVYRIRPEHPELEVMNLRKIKKLNDLDHVRIPNEEPLQLVLRVRGKPHVQGTVVDAETKQPIERFRYRVTKLRTLSGPNYVQDDNWKFAKDAAGSFRSDVIGPGVYTVSVRADGYAVQTSAQVNTDDQPDEVLAIELKKGMSLSGRVVDSSGNPVDGATVRALSLASGAMPRVLNRFVTTEGAVRTDDGRFLLNSLGSGTETIRVDHPEFAFKVVKDVAIGDRHEPLTIELSPGATIRGQVFDASGKPQANETLLFHDDYAYGGGDREAGKFGEANTDQDGRYEIHHLPETTVYVSRAEEWNGSGVVRHAVQVEDGQVHHLNFGGTSRLSGRFLINGRPLVKARLQLGGTDSTFGSMKMFVTTDDEGRFVFFGAPAGHWTLYRALEDRNSEWVKVRELDVPVEQDLDLGELNHRMGPLTVECKTKAAVLPENLQMDLRQYNSHYLFGRSAAMLLPRDLPDDPFVFQNVSPGDYEIACRGVGEFLIVQRVQVTDANIGSTIPFDIPTGKGKLVFETRNENGEPLQDTFVLWSEDERLVLVFWQRPGKESAGRHTASDLPGGRYTLRRGNARNAEVVARIDVAEEKENRIVLTLPEEPVSTKGFASVIVTDENGVVTPCQFRFPADGGQAVELAPGPVATNLFGTPGEYELHIDQPGFESVRQKIELRRTSPSDSTRRETRIRLKRAAEISRE